jgi:transposase
MIRLKYDRDLPMYLDGSREKIIAWVREGLSDRVIAERVRVSSSTVRYWRERNGIARPPKDAKSPLPPTSDGTPEL